MQEEPVYPTISWTNGDTWLGIGIVVIAIGIVILAVSQFNLIESAEGLVTIGTELFLLLPIFIIFLWRRASIKELGFRKFDWGMLALGCGLVVIAFIVTFINNLLMTMMGIDTQGETIVGIFDKMESVKYIYIS